jgi:hypothetical protein
LYRSTMEQVCLQMPAICCFHLLRIRTLTCVLGASSCLSYKIATD